MSLISTLARMEAVASGRAQPGATVRHRHLSGRPMVFVPLTTAGETGAPLGALVGTDREAPRLLVVPQPRDRDLRFAFLAELAEVLLPYIDGYADEVGIEERKETDPETGKKVPVEVELCADAPQLLVPSGAGVSFVQLLGRSMRFRRTAEEDPETPYPAPARVPLLGRWLTHYGERARVPGASLLLSMTGLLGRHWITGQSTAEDQHLGALLGWIDPPEGETGAGAALRAELERGPDGTLLCPPAGPATDPVFDNKLLAPAMSRYDRARAEIRAAAGTGPHVPEARAAEDGYTAPGEGRGTEPGGGGSTAPGGIGGPDDRDSPDGRDSGGDAPDGRHGDRGDRQGRVDEARLRIARRDLAAAEEEIRELVASQLRPTWEAVWRGIDLLRALPPGGHVADRWKRDRWSYTGHRDRVRAGEPPQPRRDDAVTAARKLASRETAQAQLDAQEALDDPLVMAARRLAGEAFAGEVTEVGMAYSEGKRPMPRPLVTVRTEDRPHLGERAKVYRALEDGRTQPGEFVSGTPDGVVVRLTGGMGRGKVPEPGSVPEPGDRVCWTLFEHAPRGGPDLPDPEQTPWTHGGPPVAVGPDSAVPESSAPESAVPGSSAPESAVPGSSAPESAVPDSRATAAADHRVPEIPAPDRSAPDISGPDLSGPDLSGPDASVSDASDAPDASAASAPDASAPDTSAPDTSARSTSVAAPTADVSTAATAGPAGPTATAGPAAGSPGRRTVLDTSPDPMTPEDFL